MDHSWIRAARQLKANAPELVTKFGFDNDETDLEYVVNGKNKKTFNKTDLWHSHQIVWHREGLFVWDFLLQNSNVIPPTDGELVTLTREIDRVSITIVCRVVEAHLQRKNVVGEIKAGAVVSSVSGRSLLQIIKLTVTNLS